MREAYLAGAAAERQAQSIMHTERDRLREAIIAHRNQRADDRCIEDDDRLYAALGDGIKCDRRVGDKAAMLANCAVFIARRCEGGGWPSYQELEAEIERLRGTVRELRGHIFHFLEFDEPENERAARRPAWDQWTERILAGEVETSDESGSKQTTGAEDSDSTQ